MANNVLSALRVTPGKPFFLKDHRADSTLGWHRESADHELEEVKLRLDLLQQRLYAEEKRSVLLVLQAMDAAGKDGTIRSILSGLNPAGVSVTSFKVPAGPEAGHDYLWRVHAACPAKGHLGVFNRSHYEDVLVVRVKGYAPPAVWTKRYRHIVEFEQMLTDEGTVVLKCFLNVSKNEQRERLQDRVDDPEKRWKFRHADLDVRSRFDEYVAAYEDVIEQTSSEHAPWNVVPADRNWVKATAVATLLVDALERIDPKLPEPEEGLEGLQIS